jgi:hypothetical protein
LYSALIEGYCRPRERGPRPPLHHAPSPVRTFLAAAARLLLRSGSPTLSEIPAGRTVFLGALLRKHLGQCPIPRPLFLGPSPLGREQNKPSRGCRPRPLLRHGNQPYCDGFSESAYRKWAAGQTQVQALETVLGPHQTVPKWRFHTHLLPRDYGISRSESGTDRRTGISEERSVPGSASRSADDKAKHL